jgi:catechol 2,3-dioxygenase-like lactoylglutathione lyase family enzyme
LSNPGRTENILDEEALSAMISNGNATIYVSDLAAAIRFYTEQLGLTLTNRLGDRWATIETGLSYWTTEAVGAGLIIGLRPASAQYPSPGLRGGVGFGVETYTPIEEVVAEFSGRGVRISSEIIRFEAGNTFMFEDLDGVPSYVHEFPPEMLDEANRGAATEAPPNEGSLLSGGHAIVYVSNMDAAIRFYAETLGLTLTYRFEDKFATVEAGRLVIAIHPQTPRTPVPGTKGSVTLGLVVDEPIDTVLSRLAQRGVRTLAPPKPSGEGGTGRSEANRSVDIEDLDGNVITLWEAHAAAAEGELAISASTRG